MKNNSENVRTPGEWKVKLTQNHLDTPTWDIISEDKDGFSFIAEMGDESNENSKANAEHICKCVNAHDELVAALELAFSELCDRDLPDSNDIIDKIDAALSKAKGLQKTTT